MGCQSLYDLARFHHVHGEEEKSEMAVARQFDSLVLEFDRVRPFSGEMMGWVARLGEA